MDSYYFERSLIPENMTIGDKYIIFWENKTFKNLGYYLGKTQSKNKETFFCFGDTQFDESTKQISTFDLIFVFRKVYGTLQQDYPCDLYTSKTVDNTRLLIKNCFYSRDDLEKL